MKNEQIEQRVDKLEREMEGLKTDVRRTLLAVQENLERETTATPRSRWQSRAWALSLLNMLMAIALFVNIRFSLLGDAPSNISPIAITWLRALWAVLALLWMMLQMYPLALVLEEEEQLLRWRGLRNAVTFFTANPEYVILPTLLALIVAAISAFLPPVLWLVGILALLVFVVGKAVHHLLEVWRRARTGGEDEK